jgi:hypothetical protein
VASKDEKFDVREIYQAKTCVVEHIVDRQKKPLSEAEDLLKFYEEQNEEIRLLSYRMLVEGMNKKYKDLDESQKLVLREYINNISNTNKLGQFIMERVQDIKQQLAEVVGKVSDSDVVRIKINEVVHQLDKIKPTKVVKDSQVAVVLLGYELVKEVRKQLEVKDEKVNT